MGGGSQSHVAGRAGRSSRTFVLAPPPLTLPALRWLVQSWCEKKGLSDVPFTFRQVGCFGQSGSLISDIKSDLTQGLATRGILMSPFGSRIARERVVISSIGLLVLFGAG